MQDDQQKETDLSPGALLLGRYRIVSLLGKGAQASVFVAEDQQLLRDVALKVFSPNLTQSASKNFVREIQILAGLNHKGIVRIFAAGQLDDGSYCLAMELVQGQNLAEILAQQGRLSTEQFIAVFFQVLEALSYLHDKGILHRDIKPANILLTQHKSESADNESGAAANAAAASIGGKLFEIKLVDFGIAKVLEEGQALSGAQTQGQPVGSAAYMSPEQCAAKPVDKRTDVYSLACVMFETIAGKPPFTGDSDLDLMYKQVSEPAPKLNAPAALANFIEKALEKSPENRFADGNEMLKAMPSFGSSGSGASQTGLWIFTTSIMGLVIVLVCSFAVFRPSLKHKTPVSKETKSKDRELSKFKESSSALVRRDARALVLKIDDLKVPLEEQLQVAEEVAKAPGEWNLEPRLRGLYKLVSVKVIAPGLADRAKASPLIQQWIREANKLKDESQKNFWHGRIAFEQYLLCEYKNNPSEAAQRAKESIAYYEKCSSNQAAQEMGNVLQRQTGFAILRNDWKSATAFAKKFNELVRNKEIYKSYPPEAIQAELNMVQCLSHAGQDKEAIPHLQEADRIARTNVAFLKVQIYHLTTLANNCIGYKDIALAEKIQAMAKEILDSLPNDYDKSNDQIMIDSSKFILYDHQGKIKQAHERLMDWKKLLDSQVLRSDIQLSSADNSVTLANYFENTKDEENAANAFEQARKLYAKFPTTTGLALADIGLGAIYFRRNDYVRAEQLLKEGVEIEQKLLPDSPTNEDANIMLKRIAETQAKRH